MDNFTKELFTRLDALANKLGVASSALWGFYLLQAKIEGVSDLACGILCLSMAMANAYLVFWLLTNKKEYVWGKLVEVNKTKWVEGAYFTYTVPVHSEGHSYVLWWGLPVIVLVPLAIYYFSEAATALYNPGYWAFQNILSQVR